MSGSLEALALQARAEGLPWQDGWLPVLHRLSELLLLGQARTNLVGDASPAGLADHVLQALCVARLAGEAGVEPHCVVDVGAGAGLAAFAFALVWPSAQVIAVEPRRLRVEFIDETARALGLQGVSAQKRSLHSAELPRVDLAVARAVWPAAEWLPKAWPLLSPRGVAAVHGHGPGAELAKSLAPLGKVVGTLDVPGPRGHAVAILRAR